MLSVPVPCALKGGLNVPGKSFYARIKKNRHKSG